jgi:TolA-binding protein
MDFLSAPKAKTLSVYNLANYNLGYVYFKREEYNGAIYYLNEFVAKIKNENPAMVADAFLRIGDSWFIRKGYDNAIEYYDKAIKMKVIDVDYAMFQKAIALGVLQRNDEKIQALNYITSNYPNSTAISEVIYEKGNTYLVMKDNEKALISFRKIASDHTGSSYAVKARLKSGLIYYNNGQNELALSTFKQVVTDYPNTPESKEALASIKNIYVDINKVDDYLTYVDGLPFTTISISEQDSMSYIAAENLYMDGEYSAANTALDKYLHSFQEGAFKVNASFYLGECQYKEENFVDALTNFEYVLSIPKSEFTESAMLKAATIAYELADYETSLDYFSKLETNAENKLNVIEAHYGLMKCNYLLQNYEGAMAAAYKLLAAEKLSDEMKLEALVIKANSLYQSDEMLLAKSAFKEIIEFSQGAAGAEAKYMEAKIEYQISDLDEAEKNVFELINQYAPYDYWVANGFILLSDIYLKKENVFQAKETLQSIIDNYEGAELKEIAMNKLQDILDQEAALEVELIKADEALGAPDTINIDENLREIE